MASPIPFAEWKPDEAVIAGGDGLAKGVVSIARKYAPLRSLSAYGASTQLSDPCIGAFGGNFSAATKGIFFGDRTKLYRLNGRTLTTVGSGLTADQDWVWKFEQFGDIVVAVARGQLPLSYTVGSSANFVSLAGSPPTSDTVGRVGAFLLLGKGRVVRNSAFNNVALWTPDLATQASEFELPQAGGDLQQIVGGETGTLFQSTMIHRLTYIGPPTIWQRDEVESDRGTLSPYGAARWGRMIIYASEQGFFAFDGLQSTPIGDGKVDKWFLDRLTYSYRHRVCTTIDANLKAFICAYPANGSTICNEVLIYSLTDGRWSYDTIDTECVFGMPLDGVSIDDSTAFLELFGTTDLDQINVSIDSPVFLESRRQWAAVDASHRISTFTGTNRAATIETATAEIEPGRNAFVSELWPLVDAAPGLVTGSVVARSRRLDQADTVLSSGLLNATGFCPVRAEGRFLKGRVEIAAAAQWTEASGVHWEGRRGGNR